MYTTYMPSKKILIISIICIGIVASLWIFQGKTSAGAKNQAANTLESVSGTKNTVSPSESDKNWLSVADVNPSSGTNSVISYPNEGTVTDQISKDFFSQYLLLIKQNNG